MGRLQGVTQGPPSPLPCPFHENELQDCSGPKLEGSALNGEQDPLCTGNMRVLPLVVCAFLALLCLPAPSHGGKDSKSDFHLLIAVLSEWQDGFFYFILRESGVLHGHLRFLEHPIQSESTSRLFFSPSLLANNIFMQLGQIFLSCTVYGSCICKHARESGSSLRQTL